MIRVFSKSMTVGCSVRKSCLHKNLQFSGNAVHFFKSFGGSLAIYFPSSDCTSMNDMESGFPAEVFRFAIRRAVGFRDAIAWARVCCKCARIRSRDIRLASCFDLLDKGITIAARIDRIPITTSSSKMVKAECRYAPRERRMGGKSMWGVDGGHSFFC